MTTGQIYFDQIVNTTGCANATNTISCLQTVPFADLQMAIQIVQNVTWTPYVDGSMFTENPLLSIIAGKYAKVKLANVNA